ncbi:MAG: hypothetical protein NC320_06980 [Clostridium sp.]|nr:hypothetical protein [Clostridium sp.]MCM1547724.1 hypothetical protein [Ruminococcus sp.]
MKKLVIALILSALTLTGCVGPKPSHRKIVKNLEKKYDADFSFVEDEGSYLDGERLVIRDEDNGFDFTVFTCTANGDPVPMPWGWHWAVYEYYSQALINHQLAEKYDNCTCVESDTDLYYLSKGSESADSYMHYSLIIKADDDDDISEILAECVDLHENGGITVYIDFGEYAPIQTGRITLNENEYLYYFDDYAYNDYKERFSKEEFLDLSESEFREIMERERVWEYDMEYFE